MYLHILYHYVMFEQSFGKFVQTSVAWQNQLGSSMFRVHVLQPDKKYLTVTSA